MVLTNDGVNKVRDLIADNFTYMAMGIGTTDEKYDDTALENEINLNIGDETTNRRTCEITKLDKEIRFNMVVPTTEGNGQELTEVGIFNSKAGPTMLNRVVFAPISKTDTIELNVMVVMKLANY